MSEKVPLFVVYDNDAKKIYEECFSQEAAEYYASERENCSVGVMLIDKSNLEVIG